MSNVIPLFPKYEVQQALEAAMDAGLTELVLVGKNPNGSLFCRISTLESAYPFLGMLDVIKHDLLMAIAENNQI
jgi:hypothetical protein